MPRKFVKGILALCLVSLAGCAWMLSPLPDSRSSLLMTQTTDPPLSPELIAALELDVAPWHKPGVPYQRVDIGDDAARRSAEIALAALEALDVRVPQTDVDRLWVQFEKASALRELGRTQDARAAFEQVRRMPRSQVMERYAMIALHELGDEQLPGWCPRAPWPTGASLPSYPREASEYRIEGAVKLIADVQADGRVDTVIVERSTMRLFEQPSIDWLQAQRIVGKDGQPAGRPCFVCMNLMFEIGNAKAKISASDLMPEQRFTFRSIGAAIRYRGEVRQALIDAKAKR